MDRLPGIEWHLLSIAEVFACTESAQSRSSSIPGFRLISVGFCGKISINEFPQFLGVFPMLARLDLFPDASQS